MTRMTKKIVHEATFYLNFPIMQPGRSREYNGLPIVERLRLPQGHSNFSLAISDQQLIAVIIEFIGCSRRAKHLVDEQYRVGGELVPVRPHHLAYGSVPRRLVKCWQTAPYKSAHHGSLACATSGYSSRTAYDGVGPETTSVCADSILSPHPQGARVRSFSSLGFSV